MTEKPGIYESWSDVWKCVGYAIVTLAFCGWSIYMITAICGDW